jgi:pimeloyl-ACP methyl ester carboxylesterase
MGQLNLEALQALATTVEQDAARRADGEFCDIRLALRDSEHEYRLSIHRGRIESVECDIPHVAAPVDVTISAPSEAWDAYLQSHPQPEYADLVAMVTERRAEISGNTLAFFQNIEFLTGLMGLLGHRRRDAAVMPAEAATSGTIEEVVGRYVHIELDGHTYRTFYEERGDGVPMVMLHAANSDARMWRHQLADDELAERFRLIAFDMPWHGRSLPPEELLRTEYLLTNDFYRRFVNAFCEALGLDRPVLVGCSMGGYIMFHIAHHDPGRYRALVAVAAREFEPRRWALEAILRHPAVSFNRLIPTMTHGFMAPTDPAGHADEVAWVYETGSPRVLRGDLHFAALDADARPFLSDIDTEQTPFFLLGGQYDWSCTEEHTDAIKAQNPGIDVVRMEGIGHFPPDENPEVFKSYLMPVLDTALAPAADRV